MIPTPVCQAHKRHAPRNLTFELHHIIPVSWQLHTPLGPGVTPPFPGLDPDGRGMLWDSRTVALCPTGHRNTHFWIVALMRQIAKQASENIADAITAVTPARPPAEVPIAVEALQRLAAYGSLLALTQAGEWGQV